MFSGIQRGARRRSSGMAGDTVFKLDSASCNSNTDTPRSANQDDVADNISPAATPRTPKTPKTPKVSIGTPRPPNSVCSFLKLFLDE